MISYSLATFVVSLTKENALKILTQSISHYIKKVNTGTDCVTPQKQFPIFKIKFYCRIMIRRLYTMNNTYNNFKNRNCKPYLFEELKFQYFDTKHTNKPLYSLGSQHRTETVPKPYRKPKNRTIRYGLKVNRNQ